MRRMICLMRCVAWTVLFGSWRPMVGSRSSSMCPLGRMEMAIAGYMPCQRIPRISADPRSGMFCHLATHPLTSYQCLNKIHLGAIKIDDNKFVCLPYASMKESVESHIHQNCLPKNTPPFHFTR